MSRVKRFTVLIITIIMSVSLTGCDVLDRIKTRIAEESSLEDRTDGENVNPVSNSISVGIMELDTFNPLITNSQTVKECMQFVYEPLFEVDEKLQPVPVLAESYTVSADGRVIDITLKNNVQWHNGAAFTATDAAYTIKQVRSGITPYTDLLADMADYKATGDYTLQIVLNYAIPNFVSLLTFPIVQYQTDMRTNAAYIPVGTGPFRYDKRLSAGRMSFAAFENYHNGRAQIDTMYVYTVPDIKKYESMFEANEIDLMTGDTVDLSEYTPRGSAKNNTYVTNKMTFVGYNLRREMLAGNETRKGLAELIDKDEIVNSVIYSRGTVSDIPINPASIYYYDTNIRFKANHDIAAQHLGNDNWGLNSDGKYERMTHGTKQVLGFEILTNSDSSEKVSIANNIATSYNEFGIPATVNALPYERYMEKINAGDYDIMIGEIEIGANLDLTPLVTSAGNYFAYQNANIDMLIGQMGMTNDTEQLNALFRQYGEILTEDMPFSVIFFRKGDVLSGAKLKSEIVPSISRPFRNIEKWSVTQ